MSENPPASPLDRLSDTERQKFQHHYNYGQIHLIRAMMILHPGFTEKEYIETVAPLIPGLVIDRWLYTGDVNWDEQQKAVVAVQEKAKESVEAIAEDAH